MCRRVIMALISLLFLLSGGVFVHGLGSSFTKLPGVDGKYQINIGKKYISEMECMKRWHNVLKTRWLEELNNVPVTDMDGLPETQWEERESTFTKYNTYGDEWLMESGSPVKKIEQCVQNLVSDMSIFQSNKDYLKCLAEIASIHALNESYHRRHLEELINSSSSEQLPFRKFISFPEIVDLMFQNRSPNTWTSLEGLLYEHTKSYVFSDADKNRRNYFATQNCDWVRLKALRNTRNEVEKLQEFTSQVRHAVNKQLASRLVKNWNLNTILPSDTYFHWLKSHEEMIKQLDREVEELRNQARDALWMCEYATELATNFTNVQSTILLTEYNLYPQVFDATLDIRKIEQELININDSRQTHVKKIADRQDEEMRCLSSLLHLVQNHRRYQLAMSFIDEEYEYAEIYCQPIKKNPGLIEFIFCNCIGSICVSHDLAAVFEEEYVLVKGSDGVYKIVRSGITSKRKVTHCHTLANSSRN